MSNISVFVENNSGFNSKAANEKFKKYVRDNNNVNLDLNQASKYIKPTYKIELISRSNDVVKIRLIENIILQESVATEPVVAAVTKEQSEKNRHDLFRSKIKLMRDERTNSGYRKAVNSNKVPDEILKEYMKLKKVSKMPIPEPAEVLSNPEEYKGMLQMVLGNDIMKQLGQTHPYVKYFKLLAKELGVSEALPLPPKEIMNLPPNIEEMMKMAGPNKIAQVTANTMNDDDTDSD